MVYKSIYSTHPISLHIAPVLSKINLLHNTKNSFYIYIYIFYFLSEACTLLLLVFMKSLKSIKPSKAPPLFKDIWT